MKDAAALLTAGAPKKYAVITVDAKLLCENGRYRLPPTRQFQLTRLLEAIYAAKGSTWAEGDCILGLDGGKSDFEDKFLKAIPDSKSMHITKQYITYTSESLEATCITFNVLCS